MKKIIIAFTLALTGCANHSAIPNDRSEWEPIGYSDFSNNIQTTSGSNSLNCGFIDKTTETSKTIINKSIQCLQYAISNNEPFKFGTTRIPTDSLLYRVLVLSPNKHYWDITLDHMLDNSDIILTLKKCTHVKIDPKNLLFSGESCVTVDNNLWPEN